MPNADSQVRAVVGRGSASQPHRLERRGGPGLAELRVPSPGSATSSCVTSGSSPQSGDPTGAPLKGCLETELNDEWSV